VVRDLPSGDEADVVLVRDREGLERVIKIYRRNVSVDVEVARRMTALDQMFLIAPYQTGYGNSRHWELMEYVSGGSLADHLDHTMAPGLTGTRSSRRYARSPRR